MGFEPTYIRYPFNSSVARGDTPVCVRIAENHLQAGGRRNIVHVPALHPLTIFAKILTGDCLKINVSFAINPFLLVGDIVLIAD